MTRSVADRGDAADEREVLIGHLREAGASEEEIAEAIAEGRLVILPSELILRGDCRYTLEDAVRLSGLDEEVVVDQLAAIGTGRPQPGERALSELNLEALRRVSAALESGLPRETVLKITRVFGRGIVQVAEGTVDLMLDELLRGARTEVDLALRTAGAIEQLRGDLAVFLESTMETHLRERLAREAIGQAEIETGRLPGAHDIAVCFADLVGFTEVSEREDPVRVGALATEFGDFVSDLIEPPVRLIKMIGDEAMLVSREPVALLEAAFEIVARADQAGLPCLRVGLTLGPAIERGGDWYGRTVNLASRVTARAPQGSIVAPRETCDRLPDGYGAAPLGTVRLKGFAQPVELCVLAGPEGSTAARR